MISAGLIFTRDLSVAMDAGNKTRLKIIVHLAIFLPLILGSCISKEYILRKGELVTIPGDNIDIKGILYRPKNSHPKSPAIIILHGWNKYDTKPVELTALEAWNLSREGYVSLALSMRGWSPTGGKDDCGGKQPYDVKAALEWLALQPGVHPQKLGLLGFSQGGQIALLSTALTDNINAIVAYFPVVDLKQWAETTDNEGIRNWYVPKVCSKDDGLKSKSPLYFADKINAPTLLIQGDQDTRVPAEQSMMMAEAMKNSGKNVRLYIVKDGTHVTNPNNDGWKAAGKLVKEFFKMNLN
jgi:dipeptidyl aminopeptidase/acylaminoacyl peptidase